MQVTFVLFRKRISAEMLMEVNEYLLAHKDDDKNNNTPPSSGNSNDSDAAKEDENKGALTLDVTCAPVNIRYSQDLSLPNEAREKLETIIYRFCKAYDLPLPRRYSRRARKDYVAFAKSKKYSTKKILKALRKLLGYVGRDNRYLEQFMSDGYAMIGKEISQYLTIITLYEQQKYMYDNRTQRCYGMDCITTKLKETQLTSIAVSVFVTNLFKIQKQILCALFCLSHFKYKLDRCKCWNLQISA